MEHLKKVAEYHFKKNRTRCKYIDIVDYKRDGDYIIFYATFKCKRSVTVKSVRIHILCRMFID